MRISPQIKIEDIDPLQWRRLLTLRQLDAPSRTGPRRLLVYTEDGRIRKAIDTVSGPVKWDAVDLGDLEATARHYGVDQVIAVDHAQLARVRAAQALALEETDYVAQMLVLFNALVRETRRARSWPHGLGLHRVTPWLVQVAGQWVLPDDAVSAVFVLDTDSIWTSLLLKTRGETLELFTTAQYLQARSAIPPSLTAPALRAAVEQVLGHTGSFLVIPKHLISLWNQRGLSYRLFWRQRREGLFTWEPCPVPWPLRI